MIEVGKKIRMGIAILGVLFGVGVFSTHSSNVVRASTVKVSVNNNESKELTMNVEDYLEFQPSEQGYQYTYYSNDVGKTIFPFGNGKFWIGDAGTAMIIISGRDQNGKDSFIADYRINIVKEKSKPKIVSEVSSTENSLGNSTAGSSTSGSAISSSQSVDMGQVSMQTTELRTVRTILKTREDRKNNFEIMLNSPVPLVEGRNAKVTFQNMNTNMKYKVSLNSSLKITASGFGMDTLIVTINGKDFLLQVDIVEESLSETTVVLAVGETYSFSLNGKYDLPIVWKSGDEGVAVINENGLLTAMGEGNAIITATVGEKKFAAVVSVTTKQKSDVANFTKNYSSASKYSQPKRMNEGFYDCSSLVWRAYHKYGHDIILKTYAPVAAAMGKYYTDTDKLIEGGISRENIENMVFEPGDLLFLEGTKKNGRYKNIHHVEMIYGYSIEGFDGGGNPILGIRYANNHQKNFKGFVGRPNTDESELALNRY